MTKSREKIEKQYFEQCAKCIAHHIPPPVAPPWMPDHYGRREELKRRREKIEEKKFRKGWFKRMWEIIKGESYEDPFLGSR